VSTHTAVQSAGVRKGSLLYKLKSKWGYIYSRAFGLLKLAMEFLGLGKRYKPPLVEPSLALLAVIPAHSRHYSGIQIMMFNAGFMNMPQDVIEMAQIDGASVWKTLYYMILRKLMGRPLLQY
jgi:raffinose/stachyose/melibiose transport system permease protein